MCIVLSYFLFFSMDFLSEINLDDNILLISCVKYFYIRLRFIVDIDKICRGGGHFCTDTVYLQFANAMCHS